MFTIYSQRLAGYLMLHGFVLVEMRPHEDGSGRNVFYFNDSPELQMAIKQYTRKE